MGPPATLSLLGVDAITSVFGFQFCWLATWALRSLTNFSSLNCSERFVVSRTGKERVGEKEKSKENAKKIFIYIYCE